jgi:threonine aldolase
VIDLRSDTLTKPTDAMRRAMANAQVGDDVYGEDPTARALEEQVAAIFGHEAALFMPSGSMANLIGIASVTTTGREVLCESRAHIMRAELGAHGAFFGITSRTWSDPMGFVDPDGIRDLYAPELPHLVSTAAISVENTHNFSGGTVQPIEQLRWLREFTRERQLSIHMDGARIWNAHVATGVPLAEYGSLADVISVCLSKGLGAPIGSVLVGSSERMAQARVLRKRLGGGMRQVGVLAAAGQVALGQVERLAQDHEHAKILAEACGMQPDSVATNIVIVSVSDAAATVSAAAAEGVAISAVGIDRVRMVTHLDVSGQEVRRAAQVLSRIMPS